MNTKKQQLEERIRKIYKKVLSENDDFETLSGQLFTAKQKLDLVIKMVERNNNQFDNSSKESLKVVISMLSSYLKSK